MFSSVLTPQSATKSKNSNKQHNNQAWWAYLMGAYNLAPLPNEEMIHGKTLETIKIEELLKPKKEIKPLLESALFDYFFKIKLWNSILQIVFSFICFLLPAISLFSKSVIFASSKELAREQHPAQHTQSFFDILGYFLGNFLIITMNASKEIWILVKEYWSAKETLHTELEEYEHKRQQVLNTHKLTMVFISLCEIIYQLSNAKSHDEVISLRTRLKTLFSDVNKHIKPKLELKKLYTNTGYSNIDSMPVTLLVEKLYEFIHGEQFDFIVDKLRSFVKSRIVKSKDSANPDLKDISMTRLRSYCNNVDRDKITLDVILYIIGDLSTDKTRPRASMILEVMSLLGNELDPLLKKIIIKSWNDIRKKNIVQPHKVSGKPLARLINLVIMEKYLFLVSGACAAPSMVLLKSSILNPRTIPVVYPDGSVQVATHTHITDSYAIDITIRKLPGSDLEPGPAGAGSSSMSPFIIPAVEELESYSLPELIAQKRMLGFVLPVQYVPSRIAAPPGPIFYSPDATSLYYTTLPVTGSPPDGYVSPWRRVSSSFTPGWWSWFNPVARRQHISPYVNAVPDPVTPGSVGSPW